MWPSVEEAFPVRFTEPLEGHVRWPYLDVLGLVTVWRGNLIDSSTNRGGIEQALAVPWVLESLDTCKDPKVTTLRGDEPRATLEQVAADWRNLKAQTRLAKLHYNYAKPVTRIRITDSVGAEIVRARMRSNEAYMTKRMPGFPGWPADAQLFGHSMSWAVGAGWVDTFKNCVAFLRREDFTSAAKCAAIRVGTKGAPDYNPGIIPRNACNQVLLHNAAVASLRDLPRGILWWPSNPPANSDVIWQLQQEAKDALAAWRGVPYRFPEDEEKTNV